MAKEKAKEQCEHSHGIGIVALILGVIGIYTIILGIKTQWMSTLVYNNWLAMIYYVVGMLVLVLAKMMKCHGCSNCDMHQAN